MARTKANAAAIALLNEIAAKNQKEIEARANDAVSEKDLLKAANFLVGWAKKLPIRKQSAASTFHVKGKFMSKIEPAVSTALRERGFATGTEWSFTMNKDAVKAAIKAFGGEDALWA